MLFVVQSSEAQQVVGDNMHCAANGIAFQIGHIESLGYDSLSGERGVTMNEQGQKLVAAFCSRPILLSSRTAHGHRIHCLKMTGIRYQMNVDFCTRASHVSAGCTHVILHIATAQNAAWIHIFKPCKNLLGGTS